MNKYLLALSLLAACGDKDEDACVDGATQCDGDFLQTCLDGVFEDTEDCTESGLVCHEDHGHCGEEDEHEE